jgi:hypothetical protein
MRVRSSVLALAIAGLLTPAPPVLAHHSVSGEFDLSKPMTLKGVVSKVEWINPHIYIYIDVKDDAGATTTWALETLPTAMMRKAGLSKDSFTGNDAVTVTVLPARDGTKHLAFLQILTFADGRFYKLG